MDNDIISPALITSNLMTRFIGQKVIYYPELSSTMDVARQAARQQVAEGTVVITEKQSSGRGRVKRVWISPRGSIALSLILYPQVWQLPYLIMLASVAVARSIESVTGLKTQLKWPNDVLINGKKVCGILIENEICGNKVAWAIIGIGINVNLNILNYPGIATTATSISDELGKVVPRLAIVRRWLVELESLYLTLTAGESVYQEWRERLVTLGKRVYVTSGETKLEGIAEAVTKDGSLVIRHDNGSLSHIVAGDVTLRDSV